MTCNTILIFFMFNQNQVVVSVGWVAASAIGLAIAYGLVPYLDPVDVPEIVKVIQVAYGSFSRLAWSVAVGWVIFTCIKGYGGKYQMT